jgi:hypothetical protein
MFYLFINMVVEMIFFFYIYDPIWKSIPKLYCKITLKDFAFAEFY